MLLPAGPDHVVIGAHFWRDRPGLRLLDRRGRESFVDIGGRRANLKAAPDGALLLRHDNGVAMLDPASDFALTELEQTGIGDLEVRWSTAFLGLLVDHRLRRFARFDVDEAALNHDPETGPTDAILLNEAGRVALLIHKTPHLGLFDPVSRVTELVSLRGHWGSSDGVLLGETLWITCYDTLCRLDVHSLTFRASERLQPLTPDPEFGIPMAKFIGAPRFSVSLDGWMIPRPYSGDILVVSAESLQPTATIRCGGRPYDAFEFDDGSLVILEHPFDTARTAHIRDVTPL